MGCVVIRIIFTTSCPQSPQSLSSTYNMHFYLTLAALSLALAGPFVSSNPVESSLTKRTKGDFPNVPVCGTTSNAVYVGTKTWLKSRTDLFNICIISASDCASLLAAEWTSLNYRRTCTYGTGSNRAFNPICSPGNCMFSMQFYTADGFSSCPVLSF
jgi:hypothetical protein